MLLKHLGAALPASLDGLHKSEALSATGKVRFCVLGEAVGTPIAHLCPGCQGAPGARGTLLPRDTLGAGRWVWGCAEDGQDSFPHLVLGALSSDGSGWGSW